MAIERKAPPAGQIVEGELSPEHARLVHHLQAEWEKERLHIAREIHDELGQSLTALKLELARVQSELGEHAEKLAAPIASVDSLVGEVRDVVAKLRPSTLEEFGLTAAIAIHVEKFSDQTGIRCHFSPWRGELPLDSEQSLALFRILQEALTNVARHAVANCVVVTLARDRDAVTLEIIDDGCGVRRSRNRVCFGLLGMQERARGIGGEARVTRKRGGGTRVWVRVPTGYGSRPGFERRRGTDRR